MANNNSLSAQALADARELRRVAEANARLSLMETFQPTLQRMVTNKLREEDEDFEGGEGYEEDDLGAVDIDISVSPDEMGGEESTEVENGGGEDIGLGSFDDGGDEEMPAEALRVLTILLAELPVKQASSLAAEITGANRKKLYQAALDMREDQQ